MRGVGPNNTIKCDFERGQGKSIIQENIVLTKNQNLGQYVDSFELRYIDQKVLKKNTVSSRTLKIHYFVVFLK